METIVDIQETMYKEIISKNEALNKDGMDNRYPPNQMVILCDGCGGLSRDMIRCSRCKAVRYCSKEW